MRSSHVLSRLSHSFDEPNLVSHGGLSAPAMLCQRIGLDTLVACTVTVPGPCGAEHRRQGRYRAGRDAGGCGQH